MLRAVVLPGGAKGTLVSVSGTESAKVRPLYQGESHSLVCAVGDGAVPDLYGGTTGLDGFSNSAGRPRHATDSCVKVYRTRRRRAGSDHPARVGVCGCCRALVGTQITEGAPAAALPEKEIRFRGDLAASLRPGLT
jgi:hypothetical protein